MRLPRLHINPTSRRAAVLHTFYLLLLPIIVLLLVNRSFVALAYAIVLISKWRMFAVRPRYWLANIRANAVDIMVGLSVVAFMSNTSDFSTMLCWAAIYSAWLLFIKPLSTPLGVAFQAFIAQTMALIAVFNNFGELDIIFKVALAWVICFSCARHLLVIFEDSANRVMSHVWGMFGGYMALILSHWQIVYAGTLPQIVIVLGVVGYALGIGYYLHKTRGLSSNIRTQLTAFCIVVLTLVIILSEWQATTF